MKKLLVTVLFFVPFITNAYYVTSYDNGTSTKWVQEGNQNPLLIMQAWGLRGLDTPVVVSGSIVTDEGGLADTCPSWYPYGCSNLTRTDYYRKQMKTLATQIIATAQQVRFPQLSYWYGLVQ